MTSKSKKPTKTEGGKMLAQADGYVAVLHRMIPVDDPMTDICTKILTGQETINEIMAWQKYLTQGSAIAIKLEIVKAT